MEPQEGTFQWEVQPETVVGRAGSATPCPTLKGSTIKLFSLTALSGSKSQEFRNNNKTQKIKLPVC